jgi:hypothetical protein
LFVSFLFPFHSFLALFWFTLPLFVLFGLFPTKSTFSVLLLGAVRFALLVSVLVVFGYVSHVPCRCRFFVLVFCYSILCGGITDGRGCVHLADWFGAGGLVVWW